MVWRTLSAAAAIALIATVAKVTDAHPVYYTQSANCAKPLTTGQTIMGAASKDGGAQLAAKRGAAAVTTYAPCEKLSISVSTGSGHVIEASAGSFKGGACTGAQRICNTQYTGAAELTMPKRGIGEVTVRMAYAGGYGAVSIGTPLVLEEDLKAVGSCVTGGAAPAATPVVELPNPEPPSALVVHSLLMSTAWFAFVPAGIAFSMKGRGEDKAHGWWFKWHQVMMFTSIIFTLVGAFLAYGYRADNKMEHFNDTHSISGLIIVCLLLPHAAYALMRPGADARGRGTWEKAHRAVAYTMFALATLNAFTGRDYKSSPAANSPPMAMQIMSFVVMALVMKFVVLKPASEGENEMSYMS